MTEKDLLDGLRASEPKIIQLIIKQHWPIVRRLVTDNSGTVAEAEDILMDGLEVVFLKVKDPAFALRSSFSTFLVAVCKHKWLDVLRRKKTFGQRVTNLLLDTLTEAGDVQAELELQERYGIYRKHWASLGASCQQLLALAFEGRSISEIMVVMGFSSEGYTRKRKHQCKEKLLQNIQNDPDFGDH